MTFNTIERGASVYEQIKKLKSWDRIEVSTDKIDKNPFSDYFLKTIEHSTRLYYFIESNKKSIIVNTYYDPCYLKLHRRKKIPIKRISHLIPLDERVKTG